MKCTFFTENTSYILVCKGRDYAATEDKKKTFMELTLVTAKQPIFMNLNGIKSHDSKNIAIEKACWEEDHNFTKEGCS